MKKINFVLLIALLGVMVVGCCPCRKASSVVQYIDLGSSWRAVQMGSRQIQPSDEGSYTLTFGVDGSIAGKGDCNRIMGSFESSESRTLTLSGLATTRAMCPDAKMESSFVEALQSVDSYSIDGEMLMLLREGSVVLILERNE
ncbi:MAG: META domain-containing protein [Rikenellaceae bacterium]